MRPCVSSSLPRSPDQIPATAIIVPSPKGMWNSRPSARFRRSSSTAAATTMIATSTNENGPIVLTIRSTEPMPAARCSRLSRRQVSATASPCSFSGSSERLSSGIARLGIVPPGDLVLSLLPAEVHLLAFAHGREVDQPALQVAEHDLHRLELVERVAKLEERGRHHLAGLPAAVRGRGLGKRLARFL